MFVNESIIVKDRVHVAQKISVLLAPDSTEVSVNNVMISTDIIDEVKVPTVADMVGIPINMIFLETDTIFERVK